tara:strand:+ start:327 stop:695 length:369 start_codon:yes stop_codon:yes gene_type:complete
MNDDKEIIKELYKEGLRQYELMDYFEAHEIWEELWSNYYLKDRRFIQGLIQLSVSFVHLGNGNMIGAKNLLRKSKEKFLEFSGNQRGINIKSLLKQINRVEIEYDKIDNSENFQWDLIPKLE